MQSLLSITLFVGLGLAFVLAGLGVGGLLRPRRDTPDKSAIYECGEPTIGSGWVQFDLRFYIVALFYLVFDVEVALIYPWAIVFRQIPLEALVLGAPFLGIIIIGYIYEWHSGSLEWVRSSLNTSVQRADGVDMKQLARIDPNIVEEQSTPGSTPAPATPASGTASY